MKEKKTLLMLQAISHLAGKVPTDSASPVPSEGTLIPPPVKPLSWRAGSGMGKRNCSNFTCSKLLDPCSSPSSCVCSK